MEISKLEYKSKSLRNSVLDLSLQQGEAHIGGCFSEIEILVSLYDEILKPEDKFILSKGHCSHPLYLLLREKGYSPKVSSHPDIDDKNGIFCTTGSLGHGLPIGMGMALSRKLISKKGNIYVLMGDGECQEGTTWETIPLGVKYKLDNLHIITDKNNLQAIDYTHDVSPMNLNNIFTAFGCDVYQVNGHKFEDLIPCLKKKAYERPKVIIADTIKGKGVSYMENSPDWHARRPTSDRLQQAYKELE